MGSAHAAGSSLEERVGNNERKITLLKNIINYKDSLLPIPKPEESDNTNLNISDRLNNIGEALGVIGGLFKLQLSSLQDKKEKDRQDAEEEKKSAREAELEAKKATKSEPDSKLKIPKLGFFETLKKFFLNVALGAATLKLIEWFKNPANRDKILAFTNFLKDNAKAIFVTLAALVALDFGLKLMGALSTFKLIAKILLSPLFWKVLAVVALGGAVGFGLKKLQIWASGGKEMDAARLKEGELQDKANEVDAIGGTIKFVIDNTIVYVDGSGNKNIVSDSNLEADCTISTSASALKDMQSGDLNPMTAVMSGKVKISGDMGLAMKVQSLMS